MDLSVIKKIIRLFEKQMKNLYDLSNKKSLKGWPFQNENSFRKTLIEGYASMKRRQRQVEFGQNDLVIVCVNGHIIITISKIEMLRIAQDEQQQNIKGDNGRVYKNRSEARLLCLVIVFLICVCVFCVTIFIEQKNERQQKQALKGTLESIGVEAFDKQMQEDQIIFDERSNVQNMNVEKIKNQINANLLKDNSNQIKVDGDKFVGHLNDVIGGQQDNKEIGKQLETKANHEQGHNDGHQGAMDQQEIESNDQLRAEINNQGQRVYGTNAQQQDKNTYGSEVGQQGQSKVAETDERSPNTQGQHQVGGQDRQGEQDEKDLDGDKFLQQNPTENKMKQGMDGSGHLSVGLEGEGN